MSHKDFILIGLALLCAALATLLWLERRRRRLAAEGFGAHRILFPFDERTLSMSALDTTLRIAAAERATLVPTYLAVVPMRVSLDAALPRQVEIALPLLDRIEERATRRGVPVDSIIEPGRSYRHALKRSLDRGLPHRVVVAAASPAGHGFRSDDVAWMLDHTPSELLVLKAAPDAAGPVAGI